jgi:hypothetical protein
MGTRNQHHTMISHFVKVLFRHPFEHITLDLTKVVGDEKCKQCIVLGIDSC